MARRGGRAGPSEGKHVAERELAAGDVYAAGPQPRHRVDLVPQAALVDLEVQMRPGGVAGAALETDALAGHHVLALVYDDLLQVGVVAEVPVAVVDHDRHAVPAVKPTGAHHGAGSNR